MSARNGPGDDDRRLHEGERRIGERLARQLNSTTGDRQNAAGTAEPVGLFDVIREPAPPDLPSRVGFVVHARDAEQHVDQHQELHVRGPGRRQTTGPRDAEASHWWWADAERIVLALVAAGHRVTSDDLHDRFPDEPSASGAAFGGLFAKLAHAGKIAERGWERSRRPQARGRKLTVWGAP